MSMPAEVSNYLAVLERALPAGRKTDRLVAELEDHLLTALEHAQTRGEDTAEATRKALAAVGTPEELARAVEREERGRHGSSWAPVFGVGACICAAMLVQALLAGGSVWDLVKLALGTITCAQGALALWGPVWEREVPSFAHKATRSH